MASTWGERVSTTLASAFAMAEYSGRLMPGEASKTFHRDRISPVIYRTGAAAAIAP